MNASVISRARLRFRDHRATVWLLLPVGVALLALFVIPIIRVVVTSLTEPEFGLGNYVSLFTDGYTLDVLARTMIVGITAAIITAIIGYPYAYAMTLATPMVRALLLTLALVPLWTSMMARNFAWVVLLERDGVIHTVLGAIGIEDAVLIRTSVGVTLGMTQVLLPFMILPLYSSMEQIDRRLITAAQSLGASRARAFFRVYLPLSLPGVVAGAALVLVIAIGFYVTPALLGSPQQALVAQLIRIRTNQLLDFGGAGALGVMLLVATMVILGLSKLAVGDRATGAGGTARTVQKGGV